MPRRAIIIGAGPAGLTAALELLRRTDVVPVVLEAGDDVGGLSRTVRYKGNRMDIGGHRFFSKSDRVMQWWTELMPPEAAAEVTYRGERTTIAAPAHDVPAAHPAAGPLSSSNGLRSDLSSARDGDVPDRGGPRVAFDGAAHERAHPVARMAELRGPHRAGAPVPGAVDTAASWRGSLRTSSAAATAVLTTETIEDDDVGEDETGAGATGEVQTHARTATAVQTPTADRDLVMLIRPRKSRIYFLRRFFDYPIRLTARTLTALGPVRTARVAASYLWSRVHQIAPETSLEDFLVNRFGRELYLTFFKSYTEKVWGIPCEQISAEWGAQRIKGLSLTTAVKHFVRRSLRRPRRRAATGLAQSSADGQGEQASRLDQKASRLGEVAQKDTDTSLIERFLYPKFGPGQLWEHVAALVRARGGEIHTGWTVDQVCCEGERVTGIAAVHTSGVRQSYTGDLFFSTMPIKELVRAMDAPVPAAVREVSEGLEYRDFITVGLLVNKLKVEEAGGGLLRDTWIYVQEPDVKLGRLQIFNNWSPHLVEDPDKVWLGLEYFCYETDDLWHMPDAELQRFAIGELATIGILDPAEVCDAHVVRVPKTYPAYFGTYCRFDELRRYTDSFANLLLIGRNGMHKYNNQDHSMLTAMTAVDGIVAGAISKDALWSINTEQEYHEEKKRPCAG